MLARECELVVAVEPEERFAQILERRFAGSESVRVVPGDATRVPELVPGAEFDAAIAFNVLEHIPDDVGAAANIRALLRPGGAFLLLVPAHPRLYGALDEMLEHQRRYTKDSAAGMLTAAGFEVEQVRYVNPVGAPGWLFSSRLLKRERIPSGPLKLYDRLVPLIRHADALRLPFGLSVWAVARRPAS